MYNSSSKKYDLKSIFEDFQTSAHFASARSYGSGHINDTFLVECAENDAPARYIIQRINQNVFKDPVHLMENIERVTTHQQNKDEKRNGSRSLKTLQLIRAKSGKSWHVSDEGYYWRMYNFVDNATTCDVIQSPEQAYQAAKAFGQFLQDLSDLPPPRLHETIPYFHNTPRRYEHLVKAIEKDSCNRAGTSENEIEFAMKYKHVSSHLLDLQAAGRIPERTTHNDTKLNNAMMDSQTGAGICVIDLDTVMPGMALYDFGDMVRSMTGTAAEDETDLTKVNFSLPVYEALCKGYMETTGNILTKDEKDNFAFSGLLITLEVGIRFLTDYLCGDVYFKTHRKNHNLDRTRVHFKMIELIEKNMDAMTR